MRKTFVTLLFLFIAALLLIGCKEAGPKEKLSAPEITIIEGTGGVWYEFTISGSEDGASYKYRYDNADHVEWQNYTGPVACRTGQEKVYAKACASGKIDSDSVEKTAISNIDRSWRCIDESSGYKALIKIGANYYACYENGSERQLYKGIIDHNGITVVHKYSIIPGATPGTISIMKYDVPSPSNRFSNIEEFEDSTCDISYGGTQMSREK